MTWRRAILGMAGLAVLAVAAGLLGPAGPIGRTVPPGTPGTEFNVSLLAEARVALALAGLLLAAIAWLPRPLVALAERLTPPLLRLDDWLRAGQRWSILLALAILVAAAVLAAYSIARHNAFNSKAYDLGLHAQVWWNTSQGRPFAGSVEVDNYLGDHVSPIILPLAPLYSLWPDARLLLLLQAAALAVGAWPLALLARRRLRPHWPQGAHLAALLLAAIYLTYPALGFVNRFEFHEEVFAVPLLLLAFWALGNACHSERVRRATRTGTRRQRRVPQFRLSAAHGSANGWAPVHGTGSSSECGASLAGGGSALGHHRRHMVADYPLRHHPLLPRRRVGHAGPLRLAGQRPVRHPLRRDSESRPHRRPPAG